MAIGGLLQYSALAVALLASACLWTLQPPLIEVQTRAHVILLMHKHLHPLIAAANSLAEEGLHVLLGVPNRDMLHFVSEATVKGVEVLLVDINEPENILRLMSRSRDIIDHLARPLAGVVMQYPDGALHSTYSNGSLASVEQALDIRRLDKSWARSFVNPLRIILGALPMLADPRENGGRILLVHPPQHVYGSLEYDDFIAHAALTSALHALRREFLVANNISLSTLLSTGAELRSENSSSSGVTRAVLHAMLSPRPRREYFVGSITVLSIPIPLFIVKTAESVLPSWLIDRATSLLGGARRNVEKRSKKRKIKKRKTTNRPAVLVAKKANTYEHLAMKH